MATKEQARTRVLRTPAFIEQYDLATAFIDEAVAIITVIDIGLTEGNDATPDLSVIRVALIGVTELLEQAHMHMRKIDQMTSEFDGGAAR